MEGLSAKLTLLREKLDIQEKSITQYENALRGAREQLQAAQQANDPAKSSKPQMPSSMRKLR